MTDCQRVAAEAATLMTSRPPLLGGGRLVCVDGRSGSGKTTLAAEIARALHSRDVTVRELAIESAYAGWEGLLGTPTQVTDSLLGPLASGHAGTVRTYDWHAARFIADRLIEQLVDDEVLVIEGVGAGTAPIAAYASLVVWCEASEPIRRQRATTRDGDDDWWESWAAQEDELFAADPVSARADLTWRSDPTPPVEVRAQRASKPRSLDTVLGAGSRGSPSGSHLDHRTAHLAVRTSITGPLT